MKLPIKKMEVRSKDQDPERELKYVEHVSQYERNQLVFIDETHVDDLSKVRKRGRGPKGKPVVVLDNYKKGQKYSVIGALSLSGVIASMSVPGGFRQDDLIRYMEEFLIPRMNAPPLPNSVIVMDNCSTHKAKTVADMLKDRGICVVYLPPYTPTMNPIETAFAKMKRAVKRLGFHSDLSVEFVALQALDTVTAEDAKGYFKKAGYFDPE